jgi:hypothetical protein
VRALNLHGIDRFRSALQAIRDGSSTELPTGLLEDPAYTEELTVEIDIAPQMFTTRLPHSS